MHTIIPTIQFFGGNCVISNTSYKSEADPSYWAIEIQPLCLSVYSDGQYNIRSATISFKRPDEMLKSMAHGLTPLRVETYRRMDCPPHLRKDYHFCIYYSDLDLCMYKNNIGYIHQLSFPKYKEHDIQYYIDLNHSKYCHCIPEWIERHG